MSDGIDIKLDKSFKYHHNKDGANEEAEAQFIRISEFSMRNMDKVAPVKEIVMKALARLGDSATDEAKADAVAIEGQIVNEDGDVETKDVAVIEDGRGMLSTVYMFCDDGKAKVAVAYLIELLVSGVAYVDGSTQLNKAHINSMSPKDFENLAGSYIGNFIIA
jgi:hypothetical protein